METENRFAGSVPVEEFLVRFRYGNKPVFDKSGKRTYVPHELTKKCEATLRRLKAEDKVS